MQPVTLDCLQVSPAELAILRAILKSLVPDREVWAFGSRVKGNPKKFSDLDLAVLGQEAIPLQISAELREAFTESDLPYKVDIVDWATTSEVFRRIIEANHCRLC